MNQERSDSDGQLLRLAAAGYGDAFGELFDRHRDRVFRHVYGVLSDTAAAEDVTAMVFYEAWRKRNSIRIVEDSVIAWLLVTANYTIRNHNRQQRRYRQFLQQLPDSEIQHDIAQDVANSIETNAQAVMVRDAFSKLSAASRDILTLCVIEELSMEDTAGVLGIPLGTVKSRLSRAKKKLAQLYYDENSASCQNSFPSFSER